MKKSILILALFFILAGTAFAQKLDKHHSGSILIGGSIGAGFTPNVFSGFSSSSNISKGNYAFSAGAGAHLDYYFNNMFSITSGVGVQAGIYAFLDREINFMDEDANLVDIAKTPISITIPVMAHINFPFFQFLYAGVGVNFNIPVGSITDEISVRVDGQNASDYVDFDTKGKFFVGVPVDVGFDFISAGQGGMRLFFRVTPEFHDGKTVVPIGLVWQIFNIRLR